MLTLRARAVAKLALLALAILLHRPLWAQENRQPSDLLMIWAGMLPIILSAPHGGRQPIPGVAVRRGAGVLQFTTERDSNTAELAEALGLKLSDRLGAKPFLVIAHFERKYIDANRAQTAAYESAAAQPYYDAYHQALEEAAARVRQRWGTGLLLDIHGQGAEADTIFRGTNNGKSVAALRQRFGSEALSGSKSIFSQLALKGYKIAPAAAADDRERRYTGGYTTQTYGSHRSTRIDAIQLEFGANLRARANLDRTASDLAQAIEIFAKAYLPLVQATGGAAAPAQP